MNVCTFCFHSKPCQKEDPNTATTNQKQDKVIQKPKKTVFFHSLL